MSVVVQQMSERAEALVERFIEDVGSSAPEGGCQSDVVFARVCEKEPELAPLVWVLLREICPLLSVPVPPPPIALIDPKGDRGDRFRFQRLIGEGGMGVVHECYDPELGRTVAIKTMRADGIAGADPTDDTNGIVDDAETRALSPADRDVWRKAMFIREAAIASRLDHPGIMQVHEIGRHSQHGLYYTMRLVGGVDLLEVIGCVHRRAGGWDRKRAIGALVKVCRAIAHAHEQGIIHRDLKPTNIKVERRDDACVIDWGLASWTLRQRRLWVTSGPAAATAPGSSRPEDPQGRQGIDATRVSVIDLGTLVKGGVVGTPDYMAPEQARGMASPVTDVYSIGAILYHLLANRKPLDGTKEEVLALLKQEVPPAPPTLPADCPAELAAICRRAMAWDVERRYAAVDDLATDLQRWLDLKVVDAYAYTMKPLATLTKWVQRNPAHAALVVLVIVLATAVVFFAPGYIADQRSRSRLDRGWVVGAFLKRDANEESAKTGESAAQWWLREARHLTGDGGLGLVAFQADFDDLRARATRQVAGVEPIRSAECTALLDMLEAKRRERVWRARMLGREDWLPPEDVARQVARLQEDVAHMVARLEMPSEWVALNRIAFDLINPDRPRDSYGFEQCAVCLAQQAVDLAADDLERLRSLDTLACALARTWRREEARACQERAVKVARAHYVTAPAVKASDEQGNLNGPDAWYYSLVDNQRWIGRECDIWSSPEEERRYQILVEEIRDLEWLTAVLGYRYEDVALDGRRSRLGPIVGQLRAMDRRLRFAAEASAADGDRLWHNAIEAIAAEPRYGRRRITPQLDLLPLGADPDSGLQEFVFLPSGFAPVRKDDRVLAMTRNSGMVMVLVPGVDGGEPFFLSKWELTNAQWARIGGWWPHQERDTASSWPVSWFDQTELENLLAGSYSDLRVPTLSEWRHACRAGRPEGWFRHETEGSARQFATFLVEGFMSLVGIQDPNTLRGPKIPNPFGLVDMVGNVMEVVEIDAADGRSPLRADHTGRRPDWRYTGGNRNMPFADIGEAIDRVTGPMESAENGGCRLARSLMR